MGQMFRQAKGEVFMINLIHAKTGTMCIFAVGAYAALDPGKQAIIEFETD